MKKALFIVLFTLNLLVLNAEAPKYGYMMTCSKKGRVTIHKPSGDIIWEHPARNTYSASLLPNGNVIFAENDGVREVTPQKELVMHFKQPGEVFCVRRLKNGDTMLMSSTFNQMVIIDKDGKEKRRLDLKGQKGHMANRQFTVTPDQKSFLVGHIGDKTVREYDFDGKLIKEFPAKGYVFTGLRSRNGDTYISWQHGVDKVSKDGDVTNLITLNEKSTPYVHWFTSLAFYSKKRIFASSWLGHRCEGKGPSVILINQKGEIEWQLANHEQVANATSFTPLTKKQSQKFLKKMKSK